jgi:hypothetical protein
VPSGLRPVPVGRRTMNTHKQTVMGERIPARVEEMPDWKLASCAPTREAKTAIVKAAGEGDAPRKPARQCKIDWASENWHRAIKAEAQAGRLAEALKGAELLIRGYRAGWEKEVTEEVLAPIREALAQWEAGQ